MTKKKAKVEEELPAEETVVETETEVTPDVAEETVEEAPSTPNKGKIATHAGKKVVSAMAIELNGADYIEVRLEDGTADRIKAVDASEEVKNLVA